MYWETKTKAGRVLEIYKAYTKRTGKAKGNGSRERTKEEMDKCNFHNAVKKLTRLMNANFQDGDLHLVLTYPRGNKPTPADAMRLFTNWREAVRRVFKKAGIAFKWISVVEYQGKNIHHHVLINNPDEINIVKMVQEKWKHGIVKVTPLYSNRQGRDYRELAEYFVKETDKTFREKDGGMSQRWSASKNLEKPKVTTKRVKARKWKKEPKIPAGYHLIQDTLVNGTDPWGRDYQKYTLIEVDNVHNSRKKERKKE